MVNNIFMKIMSFVSWYEKYGTARHATEDNTVFGRKYLICISEVYRHTLIIINMPLLFHGNSDYMNTPQSYMICTLPVLLNMYKDILHSEFLKQGQ
jgi:hypothetical protein